jgi:hypothetical protein
VELGHHGKECPFEAVLKKYKLTRWIVYNALYAYCQEMIRRGKPDGAFK